jgi:hypothetical protein
MLRFSGTAVRDTPSDGSLDHRIDERPRTSTTHGRFSSFDR